MIGQCLINNLQTIESKDCLSRGRERSLFHYGGMERHRKMAAYFPRVVQGGIVGKGLKKLIGFSDAKLLEKKVLTAFIIVALEDTLMTDTFCVLHFRILTELTLVKHTPQQVPVLNLCIT